MRITWVTRSFLDYRIPVYEELDKLCDHQLTVIFYKDVVPERCINKLNSVLQNRAIGLSGEIRLSGKKSAPLSSIKKNKIRIPIQPGLLKAIRKTKPDVMISDGFFQWSYAPILLRFLFRIRHVMCYEPTLYTERNTSIIRILYRRIASQWIDKICCNGVLCEEFVKKVLHIPDNKVSIGNMAADSSQIVANCKKITKYQRDELRNSLGVQGIVFLYVGRLVELKGLKQLFHAWKNVKQQEVSLLIIGDGPEKNDLIHFSKQNNLNVFFTGAIDYDRLPLYYCSSDIFIIPTLQDNWSLVVPEAMACGLPIACSIYNGCYPELVHPENGWLFDPYDQEATAKMLNNIVERKNELPLMGQKSREIVANHTPRKAAEAIYKACKDVQKNERN